MAHTPGNWFVDTDESDFTVSTDHGQQICRALSADDFPCILEGTEEHMDDEARANARLIAAAPDLLDALRIAIKGLDTDGQASAAAALNTLGRAAIAKAEGR